MHRGDEDGAKGADAGRFDRRGDPREDYPQHQDDERHGREHAFDEAQLPRHGHPLLLRQRRAEGGIDEAAHRDVEHVQP